jgi:CheY-like chemotaxis protein
LQAVGTLAGGIAHDFNNLLQGIFGYIYLAKLKIDDRGKALAMLEEAEHALGTAVNLTTQLLTFSKGGKPAKRLLSLKPVIEDSVHLALSGSDAEGRMNIAPDLWPVEADEGQLIQVLQNIVLNAKQAMASKGTVDLLAWNQTLAKNQKAGLPAGGEFVRVDIKDTGVGIPEENLTLIFDPYFTTKLKGNGLGLATSFSIIKNHGGLIEVESEAGKGSTFSVYLPAAKDAVVPALNAASVLSVRKARVLVMDDDELIRNIGCAMIEALGHEPVCVSDGGEAIERFRHGLQAGNPFDVVILDLTVKGGMGGEEAISRLLEIDPKVKAVVSSGYADSSVVANYREHGFSAILNKPYRAEALRECLNSLLWLPSPSTRS